MTKDEFKEILEKHDWFYSMSDDHRVWKAGVAAEGRIKEIRESDPTLNQLYLDFVNTRFN